MAGLPDWSRAVGGDTTALKQGALGELWAQLTHGGAVIDPRDVSDRAARLLGRVYGDQGAQLKQRAATQELVAQLAHAGVEIDPRQVRTLTSSDVVDVGDRAARDLGVVRGVLAQVQQRGATFDLLAQLRHAGVEIDPRSIRALTAVDVVTAQQGGAPWSTDVTDRAARLVGRVYGDQGVQVKQRAATQELLAQLAHAGVEIDPRQIRSLVSSDVVDVSSRAARQAGMVSDEPVTQEASKSVAVAAATTELMAAGGGGDVGRLVWVKVPSSSTFGIHATAGEAATTSKYLIEPGETYPLSTRQAVNAIREAGAGADVTAYVWAWKV